MPDNRLLLILSILAVCVSCATTEIRSGVSEFAKINEDLLRAAKSGNIEVVQLSLDAGADLTVIDADGYTALMLAAQYGHEGIVRLLIEAGADPLAQTKHGLKASTLAALYGNDAILWLLIETEKKRDREGIKPEVFFQAVWNGDFAETEMLIAAGVDVNAKNQEADTALMLALRGGHPEIVKLIIGGGVEVNAQADDGWTAWMLASQGGHKEVAQMLIEAGANVNVQTNTGHTALDYALAGGHQEIAHLLGEAGG